MTTIQNSAANATDENLHTAAMLAVIELLVQPEFGDAFVKELLETVGIEPTEAAIETVTTSIRTTNAALAAPLIANLPEAFQVAYRG